MAAMDIGQVLFLFSVHKHEKKERGQYPGILTEQAWSIKDLLYGIKKQDKFSLRDKAHIPSGQDSSMADGGEYAKKVFKRGPKFKERTSSDVCRLCLINLKQNFGDLSKNSYIYIYIIMRSCG